MAFRLIFVPLLTCYQKIDRLLYYTQYMFTKHKTIKLTLSIACHINRIDRTIVMPYAYDFLVKLQATIWSTDCLTLFNVEGEPGEHKFTRF